jgi:hypothetical protein
MYHKRGVKIIDKEHKEGCCPFRNLSLMEPQQQEAGILLSSRKRGWKKNALVAKKTVEIGHS